MLMILLLLLSSGRRHGDKQLLCEQVDLVEINYYYTEDGSLAYKQLIMWEWSPDYCRMHVQAWMLIDKGTVGLQFFKRGDAWEVRWQASNGTLRSIRTPTVRWTHTTYDPERDNKPLMDERYRLGLMEKKYG